jgi:hypothetical protein
VISRGLVVGRALVGIVDALSATVNRGFRRLSPHTLALVRGDETLEPTLRLGDTSPDGWVEYLRDLLVEHGFGSPGSEFDEATEVAVIEFQDRSHLKVDGVVGNQTWAALRGESPQKVGTDGRVPGAFVDVGREARWFHETTIQYQRELDRLDVEGVNTGTEPLWVGPTEVFVLAQLETGESIDLTHLLEFRAAGGADDAGSGEQFTMSVPRFSFAVGGGVHTVHAQMTAELGGDVVIGQVDVPPPPPFVRFVGGSEPIHTMLKLSEPLEVSWSEINTGSIHSENYETMVEWVDSRGVPVGSEAWLTFTFPPLEPDSQTTRTIALPAPKEYKKGQRFRYRVFLDVTSIGQTGLGFEDRVNLAEGHPESPDIKPL